MQLIAIGVINFLELNLFCFGLKFFLKVSYIPKYSLNFQHFLSSPINEQGYSDDKESDDDEQKPIIAILACRVYTNIQLLDFATNTIEGIVDICLAFFFDDDLVGTSFIEGTLEDRVSVFQGNDLESIGCRHQKLAVLQLLWLQLQPFSRVVIVLGSLFNANKSILVLLWISSLFQKILILLMMSQLLKQRIRSNLEQVNRHYKIELQPFPQKAIQRLFKVMASNLYCIGSQSCKEKVFISINVSESRLKMNSPLLWSRMKR